MCNNPVWLIFDLILERERKIWKNNNNNNNNNNNKYKITWKQSTQRPIQTKSNICNEPFCKISERLKVVIYFYKKASS